MKKLIFAAALALSLAGCATTGTAPPQKVEPLASVLAPLAGTHVDDEAIKLAWRTADAGLYAVDFMRSVGWIVDGSPKARALADTLSDVRKHLLTADNLQRAGQQGGADAAFALASTAYAAFLKAMER